MKKMKLFSDKEFYSKLWNLALPIALQNLMLALVAAADALMLGRVDQNTMSAVSPGYSDPVYPEHGPVLHRSRHRGAGRPVLGKRRQKDHQRLILYGP